LWSPPLRAIAAWSSPAGAGYGTKPLYCPEKYTISASVYEVYIPLPDSKMHILSVIPAEAGIQAHRQGIPDRTPVHEDTGSASLRGRFSEYSNTSYRDPVLYCSAEK